MSDQINNIYAIATLGALPTETGPERSMKNLCHVARSDTEANNFGTRLVERMCPHDEGYTVQMTATAQLSTLHLRRFYPHLGESLGDGKSVFVVSTTAYHMTDDVGIANHYLDVGVTVAQSMEDVRADATISLFNACPEENGWIGHMLNIELIPRHDVWLLLHRDKRPDDMLIQTRTSDAIQ